MGLTAVITIIIIIIVSDIQKRGKDVEKGIDIHKNTLKTSKVFKIGAFAIVLCLCLFCETKIK